MRSFWKRLFGRRELTAAVLNAHIQEHISELAPQALEPEPQAPVVAKKPRTPATPKTPAKRSTAKRAPAKRSAAPAKKSSSTKKK